MGFDVTFHPISEEQLRYFLFDVLEEPRLANARVTELCEDVSQRGKAVQLYRVLPTLLRRGEPIGAFGFAAAMLAGFLHPFWYARGQAFSLLSRKQVPETSGLFISLTKLGCKPLINLPDQSDGGFLGNESGSGLIPANAIVRAEQLLESLQSRLGPDGLPILNTTFDADGLASIRAALKYCVINKLGMIEASDIVVPISDECCTYGSNLRAPFLGRMDP